MAEEIRRMGRKSVAHARGREATPVRGALRHRPDLHAFDIDDEGIEAVLKSGS